MLKKIGKSILLEIAMFLAIYAIFWIISLSDRYSGFMAALVLIGPLIVAEIVGLIAVLLYSFGVLFKKAVHLFACIPIIIFIGFILSSAF